MKQILILQNWFEIKDDKIFLYKYFLRNASKIKIIKEYIRRSGSLVFFCQTRWAKIILCQTLREGEIFSMSRESENNSMSNALQNVLSPREGEIFSMSYVKTVKTRAGEKFYKSWILKREIDSISLFVSLFARVCRMQLAARISMSNMLCQNGKH